MVKDRFDSAAALTKTKRAITHPEPKQLIDAGITTRATIDYQAQRPPTDLQPEPTPDDPDGWSTAMRKSEAAHAQRIADLRARFRAKGEKLKLDFETARDYRGERY